MNVTIIEKYITSQSSTVDVAIKSTAAAAIASVIYTMPFIDLDCFTEVRSAAEYETD
jgi:hypothetical protein